MEQSPAIRSNDNLPDTTPGIGMAGLVLCPYFKGACMKQGCEMWVTLTYVDKKVGRCSFAWQSIIKTELRESVDKLTKVISSLIKKE